MIETMKEKMERLMGDVAGITGFMTAVKCKSSDGMICTLEEMEITQAICPKDFSLPDYANSELVKAVLHNLELAESNKFLYSSVENVAVKADTIVRIWAELEYCESECSAIPTPEIESSSN